MTTDNEAGMDGCPKCGGELQFGYGLAGGGCGSYEYCTADGCDYFNKTLDPEASTPEELEEERARKGQAP